MRLFADSSKVKNKLLKEFEGKRILDICGRTTNHKDEGKKIERLPHKLSTYPWPVPDRTYDLIICQNVLEYQTDIGKMLEELNRISTSKAKIMIGTMHCSWVEAHRHYSYPHRFAYDSFDYFIKGNPHYKTEFHITEKHLLFDDLTSLFGINLIANVFPHFYEKRLSFFFPATSFYVVLDVDK